MKNDYQSLLARQAEFFTSGKSLELQFRLNQLSLLYDVIAKNEKRFSDALRKDLHKPAFESYAAEIGITLAEIRYLKKNLKKLSSVKRRKTPLFLFHSKSRIFPVPYGQSLIFSAWNYPVQLLLSPLAGAMAAGNTVIVKPSEIAGHTAELMADLISNTFDPEYICCVEGGVSTGQELLRLPFHYIFFTGSSHVGKIVYEQAAKQLIPVTLELGGKNPCIVDDTAKINFAAKKIIWGKLLNAGQTCIAPDYVLVHQDSYDQLIQELKSCIIAFYGEDARKSPDYCRIINLQNIERLKSLLKDQKTLYGGTIIEEDRYIEPAIIENPPPDSPIMKEEIFGPLLPIITYKSLEEIPSFVQKTGDALTFYVFSESKKNQKFLVESLNAGSAAVNETLTHITNPFLPFGGFRSSGIGAYHGKYSFDTFSHMKPVLYKRSWFDNPMVYPPYKEKALKMLRYFLK